MRGLKLMFSTLSITKHFVASFTDAWIETLKRNPNTSLHSVASFTDAWIETTDIPISISPKFVASFTDAWIETDRLGNRLWWVRRIFYRCVDWNYGRYEHRTDFGVASFTDAWIETMNAKNKEYDRLVASFTDAWIETLFYVSYWRSDTSHLLQMRGLKLPVC